mgnify:CR=1 FL=1
MIFEVNQLADTLHDLTLLIEAKCIQCKGSMRAAAECEDKTCALRSYGPVMVRKDIELFGSEYIQPGSEPGVWQ